MNDYEPIATDLAQARVLILRALNALKSLDHSTVVPLNSLIIALDHATAQVRNDQNNKTDT